MHDDEDEERDEKEEGAVIGEDRDTFDESGSPVGIVSECLAKMGGVFVIMLDDGLIDILFEFNGDQVFGVSFFEITHVGTSMIEADVVYDGVKIHVVVVGIAGNFGAIYSPEGVCAKYQY